MKNRHFLSVFGLAMLVTACYGGAEPTGTSDQSTTWTTEVYVVDGAIKEQRLYEVIDNKVISRRTFDEHLNLVSEEHGETTSIVSDFCHQTSYPFYSASLEAWDQSNQTGNKLCVIASGGNSGDSACLDLTSTLRYYIDSRHFGYWTQFVASVSSGTQLGSFWEGENAPPGSGGYGSGCVQGTVSGFIYSPSDGQGFGTHENICAACSVQPTTGTQHADSLTLYQ